MDKVDILCMVLAVTLVASLSLVQPLLIRPALAGGQDTGTQGIDWNTGGGPSSETPEIPMDAATPTPTPWDLTPVTIGFAEGGERITPSETPEVTQEVPSSRTMITYATIEGETSGTTETFAIPYPYWYMEYTAEPMALPPDVFPRIIIQVFDAGDPNRPVRIIDQDVYTTAPETPWVEKFYEGNRSYYFGVTTRFIRSYTITLKVPSRYV
jgi:hypothetical protein